MPLQIYLEHAEELAYVIINTGANIDSWIMPSEACAVFDKAKRYLAAKRIADNGRKHGNLTEQDAADESATLQSLAEACSVYDDMHTSRFLEAHVRRPSLQKN